MKRAQILKDIKESNVSRENVVALGKVIDVIDSQFAKQKDTQIDIPGLGIQSAYGTEINLPDNLKTPEQISKSPIFLIPALSGDLYGVEPLMKELAKSGRRVISLAYPESFLGQTTEEFARSVEESTTYEPHVSYFKQAINKLIGEGSEFELWGYSTGSSIAAEILAEPAFQQRAKNAVLISPVSVVDQSKPSFNFGIAREGVKIAKMSHGWKVSDVSMVLGSKTPLEKDNKTRRKRIYNALIGNKVIKKLDIWESARVNNGEIIVVSAGKDEIAKSNKALNDFERLDQYKVVDYREGSHLSPLTNAEYVVRSIQRIQNTSNSPKYSEI